MSNAEVPEKPRGVLEKPACKVLIIKGMEDSIFPIEDSIVVAIQGRNNDVVLRGDCRHMGEPGAEEIVYGWIDRALAGEALFDVTFT